MITKFCGVLDNHLLVVGSEPQQGWDCCNGVNRKDVKGYEYQENRGAGDTCRRRRHRSGASGRGMLADTVSRRLHAADSGTIARLENAYSDKSLRISRRNAQEGP